MIRSNILLLLPLLACRGDAETGIDRTFIRGTVELAPGAFEEAADLANDDFAAAEDLGYIGARYTSVSGTCSAFSQVPGSGAPSGDLDHYSFNPLSDTTLTLTLNYDDVDIDSGDTGAPAEEEAYYYMAVYDIDDVEYTYDKKGKLKSAVPTLITEAFSDGSFGSFAISADVVGGTNYAVMVGGRRNSGDSDVYTLNIEGLDPNEQSFKIGAYQGSTFAEKGNPVGGSDVPTFTLDEETLTWSGDYEITYVYGTTECAPEDQACIDAAAGTSVYAYDQGDIEDSADPFPTIVMKADLAEVYLYAGNFASLNSGLTSGTLYSSSPVLISLGGAKDEDLPDGFIGTNGTNRGIDADNIACDTIQPKLYGWNTEEVEPNNAIWDKDGVLTAPAQELPEATGIGYVDVITATLDYEVDDPSYDQEEEDIFKITVPESMAGFFVASWADPSYNMDVYVLNSTGEVLAAGWSIADVNPEAFNALTDFEFTLEPGEEYYIAMYAWSGAAGPIDYTIEIEWLAP